MQGFPISPEEEAVFLIGTLNVAEQPVKEVAWLTEHASEPLDCCLATPKGSVIIEGNEEDSAAESTQDYGSPVSKQTKESLLYYSAEHINPHAEEERVTSMTENPAPQINTPFSLPESEETANEEEESQEEDNSDLRGNQCRTDVIEKVIQRFALRTTKVAVQKGLSYRNRRLNKDLMKQLNDFAVKELERRGATVDLELFVAELGALLHDKTFLRVLDEEK